MIAPKFVECRNDKRSSSVALVSQDPFAGWWTTECQQHESERGQNSETKSAESESARH